MKPLEGFEPVSVPPEAIAAATYRKTAAIGLRNAEANVPHIHRTIAELAKSEPERRSAIVMCAGPSLHRHGTAERIQAARYQDHGVLVVTDGALGYCLRHDLIPDFVVSVDPHPTRIVRWFGDPDLADRPADDYFRRQDLDPHLISDEVQRNHELISLVNRFGPKIRAVLSTSVAPSVAQRVLDAGMPVYWWNPIYDDYDAPDSYTKKIFELTNVPCMVTGGNCGTSAWAFAGCILQKTPVALVGMDLSYHAATPFTSTQYYTELRELFGDRFAEAYIHVWNPYLQQTWYADPTYWWYRQSFLELAQQAPFTTENCTEGGILFGEGVRWNTLEVFLMETTALTHS
ncbi:MAG: DUF115 domain-containing protein [Candidatus Omnitrophica bacterium]|nr:DUF115 domain-containing protein [Candidatus Omnitrophota bacterium]